MPTCSCKCQDCDHKFDVAASIKDKEEGNDKFNCPECKSENIKQVFSLKSLFSRDKNDGGGCCGGGCG